MNPTLFSSSKSRLFISFLFLGVISTFVLWLTFTKVDSATTEKNFEKTENYDIRINRDSDSETALKSFIKNSSDQLPKKEFLSTTKNFKIESDRDLQIPEIISPKVINSKSFLTSPSNQNRTEILKQFLNQNSELFGLDESQISRFKTSFDYRNPDGNLAFVEFEQEINGIPIFSGTVKAGFTKRNEIIRIVNNLAPNLNYENARMDFGTPEKAVFDASKHIGIEANENDVKKIESASSDLKTTFENRQFAHETTAEKMYFPIANGVVRPAWRVLLWQKPEAFYVIVDAATGTMLWRKNITEYQTQTATFNVYGNSTSMMQTADSPAPCSPGCLDPSNCPQAPLIARTDFTLIGNEAPNNFNNIGWIPDKGLPVRTPANPNITDGNNCEAGLDIDGMNGVDPNGHAVGNPFRVFSYNYNPAPGNPPPGDNPNSPDFRNGAITQGFYTVNRWHDAMYLLGFTESAGNFQHFNFGRGGTEGDRISFEVQDFTGTNGANFSTPADGGRGRMQNYIWTGATPNRDGALDSQLVVHELTHGVSSRLHGNTAGLLTNMARGMGEGWSDFYSLALLSEPTDQPCGVYPVGSYVTFEVIKGYANHYYGIRRFPTSRIACRGANNQPYNPLTFGDINAGCDLSDGAFPRGPIGSNTCDQIHNIGEIWSQALWEVRGFLIDEHGAVEGNRRALQYITDGMKLSPLNPHLLQSRDAVIAAANASDSADVVLVKEGFRVRGLGFSAEVINAGSGGGTAQVIEAFDSPNVLITEDFSVSDAPGNNNGFPEAGETIILTIPLINTSGNTITGVTLRIAGGVSAFYGDIQSGATVSRNFNFTIPCNAPCASVYTLTFEINGSAGARTETRDIFLGVPFGDPPVTFENTTPIEVPFSGSNSGSGSANPFPSSINVAGLNGNKRIKIELTGVNHTWLDDVDVLLESPGGQKMIIMSDAFGNTDPIATTITISDNGKDGLMTDSGPLATGDFQPTNFGAMDDFDAPAPTPPYQSPAPGGSATLASVFGTDGSTMNGEWKLWIDDDSGGDIGTFEVGWKITFESADYVCAALCTNSTKCDFDGDGRTDISVFRPDEGNWYLNQSTDGFKAVNWGIAMDRLAPGDYDGDGKTDIAVFRPATDSNLPDFYILNSSNLTFTGISWGLPGDIPTVEDYNGDGKSDIALFRPSDHTFYVLNSGSGSLLTFSNIQFGTPVTGDFDGDGRGDFATYSINGWFLSQSNTNYNSINFTQWGASGDKPVPADYDGDGKVDFAVFRPSNRNWYVRKSSGGHRIDQFGLAADKLVPGDYDGDGLADIAVYRDGIWYINRTTSGIFITQFGLQTDVPVPQSSFP